MRVRHPYHLDDDGPEPDGTVHWGGRRRWSAVDEDGTFVVPDDAAHMLEQWAEGYGYRLSQLIVSDGADAAESDSSDELADTPDDDDAGTCEVVKADDEVCGRERPCPYHDKR